jgi:hypothetical protein
MGAEAFVALIGQIWIPALVVGNDDTREFRWQLGRLGNHPNPSFDGPSAAPADHDDLTYWSTYASYI